MRLVAISCVLYNLKDKMLTHCLFLFYFVYNYWTALKPPRKCLCK